MSGEEDQRSKTKGRRISGLGIEFEIECEIEREIEGEKKRKKKCERNDKGKRRAT